MEDEFLGRLAPQVSKAAIRPASELLTQIRGLLGEDQPKKRPRASAPHIEREAERAIPAADGGQLDAGELPVSLL